MAKSWVGPVTPAACNGGEKVKEELISVVFFVMWIVAGSLIDGIFESGVVMMVFVIALAVIVACAAVLATDNK